MIQDLEIRLLKEELKFFRKSMADIIMLHLSEDTAKVNQLDNADTKKSRLLERMTMALTMMDRAIKRSEGGKENNDIPSA